MSEHCPLHTVNMPLDGVPAVCQTQCESAWGDSIQNTSPDIDRFPDTTDADLGEAACRHLNIEFSHESLQKTNEMGDRAYSIVDACSDCDLETEERSWYFHCPH